MIMFGPGTGKNARNADENVAIRDLVDATKVITQIVFDVLVREPWRRMPTRVIGPPIGACEPPPMPGW